MYKFSFGNISIVQIFFGFTQPNGQHDDHNVRSFGRCSRVQNIRNLGVVSFENISLFQIFFALTQPKGQHDGHKIRSFKPCTVWVMWRPHTNCACFEPANIGRNFSFCGHHADHIGLSKRKENLGETNVPKWKRQKNYT